LPVGICPLPCFKWGRNVQRHLLDLVEKETELVRRVPERVFAVSSMGFSRQGRDSSERES